MPVAQFRGGRNSVCDGNFLGTPNARRLSVAVGSAEGVRAVRLNGPSTPGSWGPTTPSCTAAGTRRGSVLDACVTPGPAGRRGSVLDGGAASVPPGPGGRRGSVLNTLVSASLLAETKSPRHISSAESRPSPSDAPSIATRRGSAVELSVAVSQSQTPVLYAYSSEQPPSPPRDAHFPPGAQLVGEAEEQAAEAVVNRHADRKPAQWHRGCAYEPSELRKRAVQSQTPAIGWRSTEIRTSPAGPLADTYQPIARKDSKRRPHPSALSFLPSLLSRMQVSRK
jgi:hypothetical protein